ncbi:MAG: histidine phosphatase family protein [Treponema sp.]|nr:histidine phosphatase family protein [Treponema sp.]
MIDLTLLDKTKTSAIVIRHADRDSMQQWQIEQPLNDEGKKHAQELGEKLCGFKDYAFFSSSVDRCQETVAFMQKGIFGKEEKPNTFSEILGRPGVFVVDRENNAFRTLSCRKVVTAQIAHEKLEGIRDTVEGAKLFVDFVIEKLQSSKDGTLLVFVTHDAIIAPVIFELTGEKFGYENWPDFSDGFIIEKNTCDGSDEYKVIRKNQIFELKEF